MFDRRLREQREKERRASQNEALISAGPYQNRLQEATSTVVDRFTLFWPGNGGAVQFAVFDESAASGGDPWTVIKARAIDDFSASKLELFARQEGWIVRVRRGLYYEFTEVGFR